MFGPELFYSMFIRPVWLHSISRFVCFFHHRCLWVLNFVCDLLYLSVLMFVFPIFSGMWLLFGHFCVSIKATKATGGSQQCHQCKILFLYSDGGIFVFLSKPRKQQEVVEPQCSSYWPVATAAFLRPQHFRTNRKANIAQYLPYLWYLRFLQYSQYFRYIRYLQDLQYSNSQPFKTKLRFATNSIYLYSCDRLVWDSTGLTSSIQIFSYKMLKIVVFFSSCIYCEVSDDSLQHFPVWVCNWVWPWIS